MKQTADSIEAEAARVRSQLMAVGADIRHHADPAVIVEAAKSSFKRQAEGVPTFLKKNADPIGMVVLGSALGAAATGLLAKSRRPAAPAKRPVDTIYSGASSVPTAGAQAKAAMLSGLGVGLGYVAAMFVPVTTAEEQWLGQPKAILSAKMDDFLKEHTQGMKRAVADMFGVSRLSAAALVGLAMLSEALGRPPQRAKVDLL